MPRCFHHLKHAALPFLRDQERTCFLSLQETLFSVKLPCVPNIAVWHHSLMTSSRPPVRVHSYWYNPPGNYITLLCVTQSWELHRSCDCWSTLLLNQATKSIRLCFSSHGFYCLTILYSSLHSSEIYLCSSGSLNTSGLGELPINVSYLFDPKLTFCITILYSQMQALCLGSEDQIYHSRVFPCEIIENKSRIMYSAEELQWKPSRAQCRKLQESLQCKCKVLCLMLLLGIAQSSAIWSMSQGEWMTFKFVSETLPEILRLRCINKVYFLLWEDRIVSFVCN